MKVALNQASKIGLAIFIAGSIFVLFSWGIKWYFAMAPYKYEANTFEEGYKVIPPEEGERFKEATGGLALTGVYSFAKSPPGKREYHTFLFEPLWASKKEVWSIFYITIAFALLLLALAYFVRRPFLQSIFLGTVFFLLANIINDLEFLFPITWGSFWVLLFGALIGIVPLIISILSMLYQAYKNPRFELYKQTILALLISFLIFILFWRLLLPILFWWLLKSAVHVSLLKIALIIMVMVSAYFFLPAIFVGCVYASTYFIFNYSYGFYGSMYSGTIVIMGALVTGLAIILLYDLFRNILGNYRAKIKS